MPTAGRQEDGRWHQKRWWIPGVLLALLGVVGLLALVVAVPPAIIRSSRPDIRAASAADQLKAENDLRGTLVTMLAGAAVAAGTFVAALNLRETQRQNRESSDLQRRGQVTERFTKAIAQLGDDKLDIRVGGIYALEQIARDTQKNSAGDLHWPIVEILTAFIREHAKPDADSESGIQPEPSPEGTSRRKLATDIQGALTVLGRRDSARDLGGVDLTGTNVQGANLVAAKLQGANLYQADLQGAVLDQADLQGAKLYKVNLQGAICFVVNLKGAELVRADLRGAVLDGANLQGAWLLEADLRGAQVYGANLQGAYLHGAKLHGARLGDADLKGAVGLTQEQLASAICDEQTKPPRGLTIHLKQ